MLKLAKLAVLTSYLLSGTVNAGTGLARRQSQSDNSALYHIPTGSPGFQHNHSSAAVTFDQHSFFLNNERIMLYSGEFHPWRIPTGPVLWRDVLEKMKVRKSLLLLSLLFSSRNESRRQGSLESASIFTGVLLHVRMTTANT